MGRYRKTGLFYGTYGAEQMSLENFETDRIMEELEKEIHEEEFTVDDLKKVVPKLKFTEKDVLFVSKDKSKQLVWLEKGNPSAGLEHIIHRHAKDFEKKLGIGVDKLAQTIKDIITNGYLLSESITVKNGRAGYDKICLYKRKYYFLAAIGLNGFITSIYPIGKNDKKLKGKRKNEKKKNNRN